MNTLKQVFYYLTLCLNILLVFLSCFSDKLSIPSWLAISGRFHPVFLHFPLAIMLVAIGLFYFKKRLPTQQELLYKILFYIGSLSAALTGILGLFLSREGGYDEQLLVQHQWFGVGISLISFILFLSLYHQIPEKWINVLSFLAIGIIIWGSHLGGTLTHGEGYLLMNIPQETPEVEITDSSEVYRDLIQPIFKAKCYTCHNDQKAKGDLVMTSVEKLLKGGKDGQIWIPGDVLNSHILQRLDLPDEDKKHMPPKGKTQVTARERQLIEEWIRHGADLKKRIQDYPLQDSFRVFLAAFMKKSAQPKAYPFEAASPKDIEAAQSPYCYVAPMATNSPALQVRFLIRSAFSADQLKKLDKVADNIVQLNLSNMTLKDEDISILNRFQNLETLILNGTDITGKTLSNLSANKALTSIALSNTKVDLDGFKKLITSLPSLKHIYCWNTVIDSINVKTIQPLHPSLIWNIGYVPDKQEILQLTSAQLVDNDKFVLGPTDSVRFKHPMPGATIKYTLDGSAPDSAHSLTYSKPFVFKQATRVRTITIRPGWLTSDTTDHTFFVRSSFTPSYARFLLPPDKSYTGQKEATLFDGKKGEPGNFREGFIGMKENPFDMLCGFNAPTNINEILVSTLRNTGSYIMPPERVELWGGEDSIHLKKITQIVPKQPTKHEFNKIELHRLPVKGAYRYFRIKVFNVNSLPKWHDGKGQKGWVFIDEIFFN